MLGRHASSTSRTRCLPVLDVEGEHASSTSRSRCLQMFGCVGKACIECVSSSVPAKCWGHGRQRHRLHQHRRHRRHLRAQHLRRSAAARHLQFERRWKGFSKSLFGTRNDGRLFQQGLAAGAFGFEHVRSEASPGRHLHEGADVGEAHARCATLQRRARRHARRGGVIGIVLYEGASGTSRARCRQGFWGNI